MCEKSTPVYLTPDTPRGLPQTTGRHLLTEMCGFQRPRPSASVFGPFRASLTMRRYFESSCSSSCSGTTSPTERIRGMSPHVAWPYHRVGCQVPLGSRFPQTLECSCAGRAGSTRRAESIGRETRRRGKRRVSRKARGCGMKWLVALGWLLTLPALAAAQGDLVLTIEVLTLDQAVTMALQQNRDVQSAALEVGKAEALRRATQTSRLPNLQFNLAEVYTLTPIDLKFR